jgi:peptide/nickel transport system substrate-binding protein
MSDRDGSGYWHNSTSRRLARRMLLRSTALGGASLVALTAACGSKSGGGAQPGTGTSAAVAGKPRTGGRLRHLLPYSAGNIDPYLTEEATGYGFIEGYWYEPLINLDYSNPAVDWRIANKAVPWLADKFEQPDPSTYVFSIRQGVKWHNGDPFSAEDVLFSFKRMMTPNSGVNPSVLRFVDEVASVTSVDDHTVKITAKRPDADFLVYLGQRNTAMVPSRYLQSGQSLAKQAVGTGPFRLTSYTKDGSGEVARFDGYWQQGRPYLDGAKLTLLADDATMGAAFAAGQTDILTRTDRKQVDPLTVANPKAQVRHFLEEQIQGIMFNEAKPPFNDPRVRQAVHLAIDRQEMEKAVYFGEGQISGPVVVVGKTGWFIPTDELMKLPGYRQPKDQDLAQAKQLLAAAGYANGLKSSILFDKPIAVVPQISEVAQAQLKKIGIDADLIGDDTATYVSKRTKGNFDMITITEGALSLPANVAQILFYSSGVYAKGASINDPELDKLFEAQGSEFDFAKRGQLFQQIERRVLDQMHKAPVGTPDVYVLNQPWVHDWIDNRSSRQTVMNTPSIWVDVEAAKQAGQQL